MDQLSSKFWSPGPKFSQQIGPKLKIWLFVTKYSVRVEFGWPDRIFRIYLVRSDYFYTRTKYIRLFWSGLDLSPAGPNVSGIFGPAGMKYSTISGSG